MPDLHINMAIVDERMEVVMVYNVSRNDGNWNAHVSIIGRLYGGAQVEVLDVTHHAVSAGCGHDTVKSNLAVMRSMVFVLTSPDYSMWLPPTVQWT